MKRLEPEDIVAVDVELRSDTDQKNGILEIATCICYSGGSQEMK